MGTRRKETKPPDILLKTIRVSGGPPLAPEDVGQSWVELNALQNSGFETLFMVNASAMTAKPRPSRWILASWHMGVHAALWESRYVEAAEARTWLEENGERIPSELLQDLSAASQEDWKYRVTLKVVMGYAGCSKSLLNHYRATDPEMPKPIVKGGNGRADIYDWRQMRHWIANRFEMTLESLPKVPKHVEATGLA